MGEFGDNQIRHLEMIQGVINRLGNNSFMIRGWALTLIAAIFALSGRNSDWKVFILAFVPIVLFWFLDGYYLHQEKRFRALYNAVRTKNNNVPSFSMDTSLAADAAGSQIETTFTGTLVVFWSCLFICVVVLSILLWND